MEPTGIKYIEEKVFFGNMFKINLKKKNPNKEVNMQVQEVQEHNMLRAENQVEDISGSPTH